MINVDKLTLLELRVINEKLSSALWDNPEMEILEDFVNQVKAKMDADPRYQRGLALYREAQNSDAGYNDGYCRAEDFYFAVTKLPITDHSGKPTGENYVSLNLCYKWNWWMNGENYRPGKDAEGLHRNFSDFVTEEMRKKFDDEQQYTDDPEELRQQMIKVGMEEKSELSTIYLKYCGKFKERRRHFERMDI